MGMHIDEEHKRCDRVRPARTRRVGANSWSISLAGGRTGRFDRSLLGGSVSAHSNPVAAARQVCLAVLRADPDALACFRPAMPADLASADSDVVAVVSPVCSVARTVDRDVTVCFRRESSDGQVSDLGRVDSASRVYLDARMDDPGSVLPGSVLPGSVLPGSALPDSDQPACLARPA
jgi:hypothetical protein